MKAWQLFAIIMLPFVFQILSFGAIGASLLSEDTRAQDEDLFYGIIFMGLTVIATFLSVFFLWGWIYTVSTNLHPKLPQDHKLNLVRFKAAFLFPLIYIVVFMTLGIAAIGGSTDMFLGFLIIFPIHTLAMGCGFYTIYFTARSLKSVELQRRASVNDYLGDFFLIWFYFIGVWVIQPRVNSIFADSFRESEYGGPADRYLK
jgi:hypothetical protein